MKRNILVVVDMQDGYIKSHLRDINPSFNNINSVITEGQKVINGARSHGDYIILLQYKGMGATYGKLRNLVKGYKERCTVWKGRCDGSGVIRSALKKLGIEPESFRIIGLYTGECVKETVEGLIEKYGVGIEIIRGACYSWVRFDWDKDTVYNHDRVRQV